MADEESVETLAIDNGLTQIIDSAVEISDPNDLDLFEPNDAGDGERPVDFYEVQYANIEQTVSNMQATLEHQGNQIAMLMRKNGRLEAITSFLIMENENLRKKLDLQELQIKHLIAMVHRHDEELSRLIKIGSTFTKAIKTMLSFGRKKSSKKIVREVEPYVVKLMNDMTKQLHEMGERRRTRTV
ncbi:hypothetical protein MP638_001590 [Amoeboaphelidium occidentale]|nr:hypothetical protein MP638_001590 [Amoeboaphelidium occidentale]